MECGQPDQVELVRGWLVVAEPVEDAGQGFPEVEPQQAWLVGRAAQGFAQQIDAAQVVRRVGQEEVSSAGLEG